MSDISTLEQSAYRIRRFALRMGEVQGQGYIGQALGWADVLAVAYRHAMNLIMLATGMFIDLPAAVLLLTPMFVPLASAVGMDTVQLGIMMIVNLSIGLYHPPIGTTLFITSTIAKVRIGDVVVELIPFYAVAIGLLLGFAYLPWLTIR